MSSSQKTKRDSRTEKDRFLTYQARKDVHAHIIARRKKDNLVAAVVAIIAIAIITFAQVTFFVSGPGKNILAASAAKSATPLPTPKPSASSAPIPDKSLAENRLWNAQAVIAGVPLEFTLDGSKAPQATASTVTLVKKGFYENSPCHRLTKDGFYILQCGDPTGTGQGGPGYTYGPIENAPKNNVYPAGTIAMARVGNDASSMGSQIFIVYRDTTIPSDSVGGYSVIGKITSGLDELATKLSQAKTTNTPSPDTPVATITIQKFAVE